MNLAKLSATALPFVVIFGCTMRLDWPEHTVRLDLVVEQGPMQTVVGEGTELMVKSLQLRASSITLESCDESDDMFMPLAWLGTSTAFAHAVAETTTMVGARLLDVLGGRETIAEWAPPQGDYCAVLIEWGSEEDAATLDIAGLQRSGDDWQEFAWREMARATTRVDLPQRLELGSKTQDVVLTLEASPVEWLEPVTGEADSARIVLQGAASNLEVSM